MIFVWKFIKYIITILRAPVTLGQKIMKYIQFQVIKKKKPICVMISKKAKL